MTQPTPTWIVVAGLFAIGVIAAAIVLSIVLVKQVELAPDSTYSTQVCGPFPSVTLVEFRFARTNLLCAYPSV